jgi:hypothetical protein
MRNRTIQYAVDLDTGLVWSRVGSEVAVPILDYEGMKPDNDWEMNYNLEKQDLSALYGATLLWTKKISVIIKNYHREFWGFKPL